MLSRRERLVTDLGFILKRMQARDDLRELLVWWGNLFYHQFTSSTRDTWAHDKVAPLCADLEQPEPPGLVDSGHLEF